MRKSSLKENDSEWLDMDRSGGRESGVSHMHVLPDWRIAVCQSEHGNMLILVTAED